MKIKINLEDDNIYIFDNDKYENLLDWFNGMKMVDYIFFKLTDNIIIKTNKIISIEKVDK